MKEYNKELCKKYPFLTPYSARSTHSNYDYDYTILDFMPYGWRDAFGEEMCEELKRALSSAGLLKEYRVIEIKEKWGELRWYDCCGNEETYEIVEKYRKKSKHTCIICGKPAKWMTTGWVCPVCDSCREKEFEGKECIPI